MKKLLYLFLIFTLIFCSSESSVEPLEIDNFQEEEYEESEEEEEYEESEEWDKGTTYYDTSSNLALDGIWVKEQIVKSTFMKVCRP